MAETDETTRTPFRRVDLVMLLLAAAFIGTVAFGFVYGIGSQPIDTASTTSAEETTGSVEGTTTGDGIWIETGSRGAKATPVTSESAGD